MKNYYYLNNVKLANSALKAYNNDDLIMTDQEYYLLIKYINAFEAITSLSINIWGI